MKKPGGNSKRRFSKFVLQAFLKKGPVRKKKKRKRAQPQSRFSFLGGTPAVEISTALIPAPPAAMPAPAIPSAPIEKSGMTTENFVKPEGDLKQCIEGFLMDQRSPHTQRAYGKDIKRFVKYLLVRKFNRGPENLNRAIVIGYKDWLLNEKLEHTTIDRHLATLRSLFRWMVEEGILEKNPAESVKFLKPKRLSTTVGFTDEEVIKILAVPNLHKRSGAQDYAILMVLFYCGLRRSELVELKTTNIATERAQKVLKLRGKGNSERLLPLVPAVWNAIRFHFVMSRKILSQEQYLFTPIRNNRTGDLNKPLDTSSIYRIVTHYARKAGIMNRVSPHSCRATAISNARDHQVSDRAIQEFAGWASPDMITRYDKRKTSIEDSAAHSISYGDKPAASRPPSWVSEMHENEDLPPIKIPDSEQNQEK